MSLLPQHGRIACSRCFPGGARWGESVLERDGWRLENNPIAIGARDPRVLVLGFSKGENQCKPGLPLDRMAFAGMRHRVTEVLRTLGLLSPSERVDDRMVPGETEFAFGSLVRCSISKRDAVTGRLSKSGDIIQPSASAAAAQDFVGACADQFLGALPPRLRLVVMLSNDDSYIEACGQLFGRMHGAAPINPAAYGNGRVTWVHTIHPSGASGSHFPAWLSATAGKQARKREWAIEAARASGHRE